MKHLRFPHFSISQYGMLLWRLLLAFAMLTLARVIFLWHNADLLHLEDLSSTLLAFRGGVRFDLAALVYLNALMLLLHFLPQRWSSQRWGQRLLRWTYLIPNILGLMANMTDVVYFRFTLNRTTMAVFREFSNENPLRFLGFLWDFLPITLLTIGIIAVWMVLDHLPRVKVLHWQARKEALVSSSLLVVAAVLSMGCVRGTFSDLRPLAPHNASLYCNEPQQQALVLNTPFTLLRTAGKTAMPIHTYFSEEEAQRYFSSERIPTTDGAWSGHFKGRNVVMIIWESMAKEWVGGLNRQIPNYPTYTPFVDSLLAHSFVMTDAYACGTQSVDAMPALFGSITRPGQPFVTSPYAGNGLTALPEFLKRAGYYTAFFHNAQNGSMGFDAFSRKMGFDTYFGMDEYNNPKDFDGGWGIWDEEFLQYFAHQLSTFRQPFFATEFTISSHHPFHLPQRYEKVFPRDEVPYHALIRYTDMSLRKFFQTARTQPWFRNTLFIITADHAVAGIRPEYNNSVGHFSIPFLFYDAREEWVGTSDKTFQQADFLPTLLDLLDLQQPKIISFGHNVFSPSAPHFAVSSVGQMYQMIAGEWVLHFDGEKVLGFYNKTKDPQLKHDLSAQQLPEMQRMLPTLKAYLQDFTHRMKDNRLRLR